MGISNACQVPTIRPIVLSAADCRYFRSLWQFLLSAKRTGLFRACAWRIYDLGLHQRQLERLRRRFQWCEFIKFDFSQYPEHVDLASNSYAWKPIIIADNVTTAVAPVFWFDSATILHTKLECPLAIVAKNGIWALKSKSPLYAKCDPSVMDALEVPIVVRHLSERAAGALGFDPGHAAAVQLAVDWKHHALVREHIVPKNAASFHKQDQAVFNCLLLKAAAEGTIILTDDEVDISSARPTKDITTRNVVDPSVPIWADPLVRLIFLAYKKADQLNHQWKQFSGGRLGGARRWWKEHFTVYIFDVKHGITHPIPSPAYGYYADPFLWQHGGSNWLFVEEFEYAKDRGRLVVMELTDTLAPISPRPLISTLFYGDFNCHASFPHIFEMNGSIYMIPETCERRSVDLYVCEQWPDRWRLERRLLFDLDAVDTMALWCNGFWWLITSVRTGTQNRHLEIFFTDDLVSGSIHAHPRNDFRLYENMRNGTGRNAGYLAQSHDLGITRLMQKSDRHYGEGVATMEVVALNTEHFEERLADGIQELPIVTEAFATHHVSRLGDLIAYDVRDRAR
jgi:hypothetical protein